MKEFSQKLHRDLGPTRLWGYDGTFPGPKFEVLKNETVFVKWMNDLPNKYFLPIDTTVHGSEITLPEGRSVVHLHGGRTPAHSDGYPEAWFTRNFEQTGPLFEREVYTYPNRFRILNASNSRILTLRMESKSTILSNWDR